MCVAGGMPDLGGMAVDSGLFESWGSGAAWDCLEGSGRCWSCNQVRQAWFVLDL